MPFHSSQNTQAASSAYQPAHENNFRGFLRHRLRRRKVCLRRSRNESALLLPIASSPAVISRCVALHEADIIQPQILLLQAARNRRHLVRQQPAQIPFFAANGQPHIVRVNHRPDFHIAKCRGVHSHPHLGLPYPVNHLCHLHRTRRGHSRRRRERRLSRHRVARRCPRRLTRKLRVRGNRLRSHHRSWRRCHRRPRRYRGSLCHSHRGSRSRARRIRMERRWLRGCT
jgi:hypothetical protein